MQHGTNNNTKIVFLCATLDINLSRAFTSFRYKAQNSTETREKLLLHCLLAFASRNVRHDLVLPSSIKTMSVFAHFAGNFSCAHFCTLSPSFCSMRPIKINRKLLQFSDVFLFWRWRWILLIFWKIFASYSDLNGNTKTVSNLKFKCSFFVDCFLFIF